MSAGKLKVQQAYLNEDFSQRQNILKEADAELKHAAQEFPYAAQLTEENCNLLMLQRDIASKFEYPLNDFVGHPLSHTIFELLYRANEDSLESQGNNKDIKAKMNAMMTYAKKIVSTFKVPPKRYYHIRIRAHAKAKNWSKLKSFRKRSFLLQGSNLSLSHVSTPK